MATSTTSLVCGNASHSRIGSRPTTATGGMCRQLTGATCHMRATSVKLLPFPSRSMQIAISSYRCIHASKLNANSQRHAALSYHCRAEMRIKPVPEVARPRRLVECLGKWQELLAIWQRHLANYFPFLCGRPNSRLLYRRIHCQKGRRRWSAEMRLIPVPEVARVRRVVECLGNWQELLAIGERHLSNYFPFRFRRPNSRLLYHRIIIMATSTTSLVCGNASHSRTGNRPTTATGGMPRELSRATCIWQRHLANYFRYRRGRCK